MPGLKNDPYRIAFQTDCSTAPKSIVVRENVAVMLMPKVVGNTLTRHMLKKKNWSQKNISHGMMKLTSIFDPLIIVCKKSLPCRQND
jgi:hypothetical protein